MAAEHGSRPNSGVDIRLFYHYRVNFSSALVLLDDFARAFGQFYFFFRTNGMLTPRLARLAMILARMFMATITNTIKVVIAA